MSKWEPIVMLLMAAMFYLGMLLAGSWIVASCEARGEAYFNGHSITCTKAKGT